MKTKETTTHQKWDMEKSSRRSGIEKKKIVNEKKKLNFSLKKQKKRRGKKITF